MVIDPSLVMTCQVRLMILSCSLASHEVIQSSRSLAVGYAMVLFYFVLKSLLGSGLSLTTSYKGAMEAWCVYLITLSVNPETTHTVRYSLFSRLFSVEHS